MTVLCCAVTDAPRLAVHRGPEAMHRLMQAFFAAAQEVIQRYDGTIMYVTGEDFTAVFGAPSWAGGSCSTCRAGSPRTRAAPAYPVLW